LASGRFLSRQPLLHGLCGAAPWLVRGRLQEGSCLAGFLATCGLRPPTPLLIARATAGAAGSGRFLSGQLPIFHLFTLS